MTKWHDKKVGVLLGGLSSEREVSFASGRAVADALISRGYDVVTIDAGRDVAERLVAEGVQVVWNALHGKFGEDGAVNGILEVLGIPYTGSSIVGSAVAMDKVVSKLVFEATGLPIAPFEILERGHGLKEPSFGFPAVVKPNSEGSSVGITIVRKMEDYRPAVDEAFRYDDRVVVEKYLPGSEIQVAILGEGVLGEVEVVPGEEFYNYKAKYHADDNKPTQYFVPARIDDQTRQACHKAAYDAHRALGCSGYSRVDLIVCQGKPYVLEVNSLPGMTSKSLVPKIARQAGIEFDDLVERILLQAKTHIGWEVASDGEGKTE